MKSPDTTSFQTTNLRVGRSNRSGRTISISQSALAREPRINRASGMALASLLDAHGYVTRLPKPGRNQMALVLTGEGRAKLDKACEIEEALVAETMGWISEGAQTDLIDIPMKIATHANRIGNEIHRS